MPNRVRSELQYLWRVSGTVVKDGERARRGAGVRDARIKGIK